MNQLHELWREEKSPRINGILYPDGRYYPVRLRQRQLSPKQRQLSPSTSKMMRTVVALSWLDLEAELRPVFLFEFQSVVVAEGVMKCGGGSQGGDGYVALENSEGTLVWLAFFESSNPFMRMKYDDGQAVAISEYEHRWIFPVAAPETFWID